MNKKSLINRNNTKIISPYINPFKFPDLLRWRYLIYLFVKRDFKVYYQQTIFGPLWYLIQPLASTSVLSIIFGRIVRLPTDEIPHFLFYFSGNIVWSFFCDCFTRASQSFVSTRHNLSYATFPRLTIPIAGVLSAFIQFGLQFLLFIIIYLLYYGDIFKLSFNLLLLLPSLIQLSFIGIGGGLLIASLTSKYRDLSHLTGFGMQLLYFCTPLIYPLSMVPSGLRSLYAANPLTSIIEIFRTAFFGTTNLFLFEYFLGWIVTTAVLFSGLVIFNIIEKRFIDTA